MFESLPPEPAALRSADDAAVVAAIEAWGRIEAAAAARRLDAIAELERRNSDDHDPRQASALNLRHGKASGLLGV